MASRRDTQRLSEACHRLLAIRNRSRLRCGELSESRPTQSMNRRTFLKGAAVGTAALAYSPRSWSAQSDLDGVRKEIEKRHDEAVRRLQEWIHQPSIAAENRGVSEGCELTMQMLREAGFQQATRVATDGQPGIFATLVA